MEPYLDVAILQISSTYFSITYTFELDTPVGAHDVNLVTQAYRDGEDAVDLYTDTISCNVAAAQYDVAEEEDQESFVDQILQVLIDDPYLEPAPEASYSFTTNETILIDIGKAVDPQGVSEVAVTAELRAADTILEFTGAAI